MPKQGKTQHEQEGAMMVQEAKLREAKLRIELFRQALFKLNAIVIMFPVSR